MSAAAQVSGFTVALPSTLLVDDPFMEAGSYRDDSTIFHKTYEGERRVGLHSTAAWTRARPKAVLRSLPLDLLLKTGGGCFLTEPGCDFFFKWEKGAKKGTLFHPQGLGGGFSLWRASGVRLEGRAWAQLVS